MRYRRQAVTSIEQRHANGRWVMISERRTSDGGTAGLRIDITELKRAQADADAARARMTDFADASNDWFWESDAEGRVTYLSDSFETATGSRVAERIGALRRDLDRSVDPDNPDWDAHLADVAARRPYRDFIFKAQFDSEVKYLSASGKPLFSADGSFLGYRGSVREVTKQIEADGRRRELEIQLHHAQKLEALGQLAGGIAHDLNNALVPVLGLTKTMMGSLPLESRARSQLALVVKGAERARDLVAQVLAFSRKEAPQRRSTDLALVLGEAMRMLHASLPATIRLTAEYEKVPPVLGDPDRLHQVIVNLVTNAAQAIGGAQGEIRVTLRSLGGRSLRLSIADTGCGIEPAVQARIFEPFFTTKEVGKGTGLGLSAVHGIVTSHGGTISVESTPGEGACFHVTLPAMPVAASTDLAALASAG